MKVLQECLLVLHFVGIASLLGGFLTQMAAQTKRVVPAMLHGAATMLVTGLGLYAVDDNGLHHAPPAAKMAVKLGILVVIAGLIWTQRTKEEIAKGVYFGIGGLTLANIVIAVFWH
ncbi:hypothetical protein [Catenulispora pinisilvae]|uniref:hypothetical protein n=1 Tax=Catenulispora pinisilvae TaxID=2705253 RepID=UPI001891477E|nr:hypothetical protein [Catenulispora pinisilvae]